MASEKLRVDAAKPLQNSGHLSLTHSRLGCACHVSSLSLEDESCSASPDSAGVGAGVQAEAQKYPPVDGTRGPAAWGTVPESALPSPTNPCCSSVPPRNTAVKYCGVSSHGFGSPFTKF